jgi:primosomal replication protein N
LNRNQVVIEGTIAEAALLRYTPAGIAISEFRLIHESRQLEAEQDRAVQVELSVLVMGDAAIEIAKIPGGSEVAVKGFLSRRSQKSDYPVLHINQFKLLK